MESKIILGQNEGTSTSGNLNDRLKKYNNNLEYSAYDDFMQDELGILNN